MAQVDEGEEDKIKMGSIPLLKATRLEARETTHPDPVLYSPEPIQLLDSPSSKYRGPVMHLLKHRGQGAICGPQGQCRRLRGRKREFGHSTKG